MAQERPRTVPRLERAVFAVWAEDGPDAQRVRADALDGHLAHIERNHHRYLVAGPMRRDGAQDINGSLLVVFAEDEASARALMEEDPYFAEGAFARVHYRRLTPAAGEWIGGVIWRSADDLRALARG